MERRDWLRIIDANLNRAREALRVIEDVWRFGPSRGFLVPRARHLRHRVGELPAKLGLTDHELLAARDVASDALAIAPAPNGGSVEPRNFARASEALRSIEEAARGLGAMGIEAVAGVRFSLYTLQHLAETPASPRARLVAARLCVLIDPATTDRSPPELAATVAAAGAPLIQVRCKSGTDRERVALATAVVEAVREYPVLVLVNDRADVAVAAGADGVHLGLDDLPVAHARSVVGGGRIIGATAHSPEEVDDALAEPGHADYLGYGTVFPSPTKPERPACGPEAAAAVARACPIPVFAIGGITPQSVATCRAAGIERVAVGSAVGRAGDPAAVVRALLAALQ